MDSDYIIKAAHDNNNKKIYRTLWIRIQAILMDDQYFYHSPIPYPLINVHGPTRLL